MFTIEKKGSDWSLHVREWVNDGFFIYLLSLFAYIMRYESFVIPHVLRSGAVGVVWGP